MGDVSAALETAAGAFGASALGITARGAGGVTQRWTGLDPSFEHAYLSHYHASDPWLAGGLRVGFDAGSCRTGTELVRPEANEIHSDRAPSGALPFLFVRFGPAVRA